MKRSSRKPALIRKPEETRAALVDAAEKEFNTMGFFGTDTNRIARAAGYAPQTFYRHFEDKLAVFLAVYDRWWCSEGEAIAAVTRKRSRGAVENVADIVISYHAKWRGFRRSLRHLAVENDRVRAARAAARLAQIAALKALPRRTKISDSELTAALLKLERLCDAVAENEFLDIGVSKKQARRAVIAALRETHGY
ncbi:MAG: TetR/AcrR family transcriptional regulator [Proteobacteria bacterium]|nr:TetR/AcrR family transcriptional regulator [Pseudomonadota bacterium]